MKLTLSPAASRALAFGLLLLPLGLIYAAIVAPVWDDYAATEAHVAALEARVAHDRRVIETLPAARVRLAALSADQAAETGFLPESTETQAAADLIGRIERSVAATRGRLVSTELLPTHPEGGFRQIAVKAELHLTLPELQNVLNALEASPPFLTLDMVDIRTAAAERRTDRAPSAIALEVSVQASGYMRDVR